MQCDEFDARLDRRLDRHQAPDADPLLRQHARLCPRCHEQLTAATRLMMGLKLLDTPPLGDDFTRRVVQQVAPATPKRRVWRAPLTLAVAATLLIALLPGTSYLLRTGRTWFDTPPTPTSGTGDIAYMTSAPSASTPATADVSPWLHYRNSILQLYPEQIRTRHRQQLSALARDLSPIATPFNTAMTAIRRTIPVSQPDDKGQPSASTTPRAALGATHT